MYFLEIKDPEERDAVIADYLRVKQNIKDRNLEERTAGLTKKRELEETFAPVVVAANEEMARNIVHEITPLTEQIRKMRQANNKPYGPYTEIFLQKYMDGDVDKIFGIRYENNIPLIGNQVVSINNDDIAVNGRVYKGTPGLWSLITDRNPKEYTYDDYNTYKEILYVTSPLHQHYDPNSRYPRASKSKKWKNLLASIWSDFQLSNDGTYDSDSDDDVFEDSFMNAKDM